MLQEWKERDKSSFGVQGTKIILQRGLKGWVGQRKGWGPGLQTEEATWSCERWWHEGETGLKITGPGAKL